jgi:hypothetical protein
VIRGCYEVGLRVPEDVALIGFHDIPTARYTTPALTTIGHPLIELGEMAADSLFALLQGDEVAERDRTVPVSLVIRESCGAAERPHPRPLSCEERGDDLLLPLSAPTRGSGEAEGPRRSWMRGPGGEVRATNSLGGHHA